MKLNAPGMNAMHVASSARIGIAAMVVALACAVRCGPLAAQAQATRFEPEDVIRAEHGGENLQHVPLCVSALPSSELDTRDIIAILELSATSPSAAISDKKPALGSQLRGAFFRGYGSDPESITDERRVRVYLDGVYLGSVEGRRLDVVRF